MTASYFYLATTLLINLTFFDALSIAQNSDRWPPSLDYFEQYLDEVRQEAATKEQELIDQLQIARNSILQWPSKEQSTQLDPKQRLESQFNSLLETSMEELEYEKQKLYLEMDIAVRQIEEYMTKAKEMKKTQEKQATTRTPGLFYILQSLFQDFMTWTMNVMATVWETLVMLPLRWLWNQIVYAWYNIIVPFLWLSGLLAVSYALIQATIRGFDMYKQNQREKKVVYSERRRIRRSSKPESS